MRRLVERITRPFLFSLDPEQAHGLAIKALETGLTPPAPKRDTPRLRTEIAGLAFPNPLGMAAGFDKNAQVPDALLRLGFGFVECGTVTPRPQAGNDKPRIFRLVEDRAVINRLGFNNEGLEAAKARLERRTGRGGIVGINIGTNKDASDRIAAYEQGVHAFARLASYLTINISSPNTAGLRDLQGKESLGLLLSRVCSARDAAAQNGAGHTPLFLKIAPDLDEQAMEDIATELAGSEIDGLIVSNTTLSRSGLASANSSETGGMSGEPLFERSTIVLARMRRLVGPKLPIIGVGGVHCAETALEKIKAGADLVQLYTGMIYEGASLPARIVKGLDEAVARAGVPNVAELRDSRLDNWADKRLPD